MNFDHKLSVGYKIWLEFKYDSQAYPIIGENKIELLKKIVETGSIHSASEDLNLDFKKAYDMLLNIQDKLGDELLFYSERGRQGGTKVTMLARALIDAYDSINMIYAEFTEKVNDILGEEGLAHPTDLTFENVLQ